MTNRERVIRSLNHQESDIVPYSVSMTVEAHEKMARFYDDADFLDKIGNHITAVNRNPVPGSDAWVKEGNYRDEFGVVWDRTKDADIGFIHDFIVTPENLKSHRFPDPTDPRCYAHLPEALDANPGQFMRATIGFSLFERAWTLRGMEHLLMDFVERPEFVNEFLDLITGWVLAVVREYNKYSKIDAIYFGDDWGQQQGLIMGPRIWREFLRPRLARIYAEVKGSGKFVMIHSCGDIQEIIPDLIEIGLDVLNPFQPEVMDVHEMKKLYGDRLSFYGGISLQKTLSFGTTEDVCNEVIDRLRTIGKDGGYICNACHAIPRDVPAENIDMLIRTLREQS